MKVPLRTLNVMNGTFLTPVAGQWGAAARGAAPS
ncbi:hypothetical protein KALB_3838 [Kutzneria albida DSM 43870]|uniref:Uncharacterized protein n=1 Tax=Kutzneria albida DSM 43870 TaxID=1449976 RepID=W5W8H3_9PSEU|nr:hypothetical protein KALB_3838 [Kutzneria albida DSM 43870]